MDRRTAITTAVAITVTTLAGGSAIAANVGILGADETGNVGELSPVAVRSEDTTPTTDAGVTVETVYVDETVPGPVGATPAPTAPAPAPTAAPPPPATAVLPQPTESSLQPSRPAQVEAAVAYLANELGVAPETIQVLSVEEVTWPDTSLGCPQPGMAYAQVLVPGFRIRLRSGGQDYALHTDGQANQVVLCRQAPDVVSSPEAAFYTLLDYLDATFPGFGLAQVRTWSFEDRTAPGLLGASTFVWSGGDWALEVSFPVVPQPTYQAALSHSRAGVVWRGSVEGGRVTAFEQELVPAVEVGPCDQSISMAALGEWAEVVVTVQDGAIHIEQKLAYVCCAELSISAGRDGNVLRIIETNVGEVCRCMCGYQVVVDLPGLPAGDYAVEVWGVQHEDVHPLELLGSAQVTVP